MMRAVLRILGFILPSGVGQAALADLERELSEARARRGRRTTDGPWLVVQGLRIAVRLRLAGVRPRLSGLGFEAKTTLRGLGRTPLVTLTAAGILSLGVAAPTIMYSLVRAIGADLPVPEPDEVFHLGYVEARFGDFVRPLPAEVMAELRRDPPSWGPVAAYAAAFVDLTGGPHPERVIAGRVTPDLFEVLGVPPLRGRGFVAADVAPEAPAVVLVGERLWRERFGADPAFLDAEVRIDGAPATVVGVVPSHVRLPSGAGIWIPVEPEREAATATFDGIARLPARSGSGAARDELLAGVAGALQAAPERVGEDPMGRVRPYSEELIDAEARTVLPAMLLLAGLVLLIACANVANLLLARAVTRGREVAVRVAMGASRIRVAGHQLVEAALVASLGGALGAALAVGGVALLRRALADELAWWMELRLDAGVLAFAASAALASALLAGLLPALHAARSDPDRELRGGARAGDAPRLRRASRALVVAEVAFSVAVLVVSGLMVRGALTVRVDDVTRGARSVLVAAYTLPPDRPAEALGRLAFHRGLSERIESRPGVEAVAQAGFLPGVSAPRYPLEIVGSSDPAERPSTHQIRVSPGTFDLLGAPITRGRDITWRDGGEDPAAVVVNEAFARRWLPEGDPLGRRVRLLPPAVDDTVEAVIVGVAPPLGIVDRGGGSSDALYFPPAVSPGRGAFLLVRTRDGHDPLALLAAVRSELAALDPDRPLYDIATLAEHQRKHRFTEWFFAGLFATFGLAGLVMASAGLYAVIAFSVGRRRREVGIRAALGAGPERVLWTMGRGAVLQLALGLALGAAIAAVLAPAFGPALMGADPRDPIVYVAIVVTIGLTGLVAAAVPAARALRVNPAEALQAE